MKDAPTLGRSIGAHKDHLLYTWSGEAIATTDLHPNQCDHQASYLQYAQGCATKREKQEQTCIIGRKFQL